MTAGEDQTQPVVRYVSIFRRGSIVVHQLLNNLVGKGCAALALADLINALEASCGGNPRAGIVGHAVRGPLLHGGGKGFLQTFFGQLKVAQQAYQGGKDASGFFPIQGFDQCLHCSEGCVQMK